MTAYLHDLACSGPDECRCATLYPVTSEQAFDYTSIAGVSGEPDNLSRGASPVLTPLAARRRVHGSKP